MSFREDVEYLLGRYRSSPALARALPRRMRTCCYFCALREGGAQQQCKQGLPIYYVYDSYRCGQKGDSCKNV